MTNVVNTPLAGVPIVNSDRSLTEQMQALFEEYERALNALPIITTTDQLEDITSEINTSSDKGLGYPAINSDTGVLVFASGDTNGAVWHYYNETTAHTPA